jgi:hypothetical protein
MGLASHSTRRRFRPDPSSTDVDAAADGDSDVSTNVVRRSTADGVVTLWVNFDVSQTAVRVGLQPISRI